MPSIHLIKLVVGLPDLPTFARHQDHWLIPYKDGLAHPVWTRHKPKRDEELLNGGSMYRVMKNRIQFRQRIIGFEEHIDPDKGKMCLILCDPDIIQTVSTPKRAFQGWRYLKPEDAPDDIGPYDLNDQDDENDPVMGEKLAALGLV